MATQCLSTDDLCLLTNNLPDRVKSSDTFPHYPASFWIPSFEGMTTGCGVRLTALGDKRTLYLWGDVS